MGYVPCHSSMHFEVDTAGLNNELAWRCCVRIKGFFSSRFVSPLPSLSLSLSVGVCAGNYAKRCKENMI